METAIEVLVIGGGAAGSAAALQLGRIRRSVVAVDAGEPRNAPAAHMHGYLGHDGRTPGAFLEIAHTELAAYGVVVTPGRITKVVDAGDRLRCTADNGDTYNARRVVLASGLTDILPDIDGVREHWGERVIHCPWCHGWEVRDQRIAVIDTSGTATHQALGFAQVSNDVTLIRNHHPALDDDEIEHFRLGGVKVETHPATSVTERDDQLEVAIDGGSLHVDVVVVGPRFEPNASMVDGLVEIADHMSGTGRHVVVDEMGRTSHPRIFAVGNVADPMQQVLHAAAHGSRTATMLNVGLTEEDIERNRRSATDRIAWDERYDEHNQHDGRMWSGRPNGSLVAVAGALAPGRALDVGCGEGADAIWLARQGWTVTATDISTVAIDRARRAAGEAGVDVTFDSVDVIADPPSSGAFDLVVVGYPALERSTGLAAIHSIAAAVACDGRLLVIGHVHDEQGRRHACEHGFDPDEYVSVDDILHVVDTSFVLEVDDQRERPDAPPDAHHSLDRVLLARRTSD